MRLSDTLVRCGGDEFVARLPDTEPIGVRFLAARLLDALAAARLLWHRECSPITVRSGVASLPTDAADGARLLARSAAALYDGKRSGRNGCPSSTGGGS